MGPPSLISSARVPIASLSPSLEDASSLSIKAVVTLLWPFSSSTRAFAFVLAEEDIRLRRAKGGQVRVALSGPSAKAVAASQLGIGDVVSLRLDGVDWKQRDENVRTPGKSLDWDLEFKERIVLEIYRDNAIAATIDVDHPPLSPPPRKPLPISPLPNGRPLNDDVEPRDVWSSPAFLKHPRVSSGLFFNPEYDPFVDNDDYILGSKRKRRKISADHTEQESPSQPIPAVGTNGVRRLSSPTGQDLVEEQPSTISIGEDAGTQATVTIPDSGIQTTVQDVEMSTVEEGSQGELPLPTEARSEAAVAHPPVSYSELPRLSTLNINTSFATQESPSPAADLLSTPKSRGVQQVEALSDDDDETRTPNQAATPRLAPLASPGLPVVSPLMSRAGPPGSYFPFALANRSELDLTAQPPAVETPLRTTLSVPEAPIKEPSPSPAVPEQEFPESPKQSLEPDEEDEESDNVYEEEPGTIEFEEFRSDIPHAVQPVIFGDNGVEDDEEESEQEGGEYEHVSEGDDLMRHDKSQELETEDERDELKEFEPSQVQTADVAEEKEIDESKTVRIEDTALEEQRISTSLQLEAEAVMELVHAARASLPENVESSPKNGQDETGPALAHEAEQSESGHDEEPELDEADEEEGGFDTEAEEDEEELFESDVPPVARQRLHILREEIIDLTEDSSDDGAAEVGSAGPSIAHTHEEKVRPETVSDEEMRDPEDLDEHSNVVPGVQSTELPTAAVPGEDKDQSEEGSDIEMDGSAEEIHERKPDVNEALSMNENADLHDKEDKTIVQDENKPGQAIEDQKSRKIKRGQIESTPHTYAMLAPKDTSDTEFTPSSPKRLEVHRFDAASETCISPVENTKPAQPGVIPYPELSHSHNNESIEQPDVQVHRGISSFTENDIGPPADPQLATQLLTPTATATASQFTSILSRGSTETFVQGDHSLPTPQDTQSTLHVSASQSNRLAIDGLADSVSQFREHGRRSMDVPEAIGMWFKPKRPSEVQTTRSESSGSEETEEEVEELDAEDQFEEDVEEEADDVQVELQEEDAEKEQEKIDAVIQERIRQADESRTVEEEEEEEAAHDRTNNEPEAREESMPRSSPTYHLRSHHIEEHKGMRTQHAYFSPLSDLRSFYNRNTDVIAISSTDPPKAERATRAPKDYYTTLALTDTKSLASSPESVPPSVTIAQVFRPYVKALPAVSKGDVILLRSFKVQSKNRKMMLVSTDESAWVVFKRTPHDAREEHISGPPVEFGEMEREYAEVLWSWWDREGHQRFGDAEETETSKGKGRKTGRGERANTASPRMKLRSMGKASSTSLSGLGGA